MVQQDVVSVLLNDVLPREGGLLVMLKAYLDTGSKKEAGRVVAASAALFYSHNYDFFVHEWQPLLDRWNAPYFHATDFYPGAKPYFSRERADGTLDPLKVAQFHHDSKLIPEIIARHVHKLFVVSFREEEYLEVAPAEWRKKFGGVYRIAAQALTSVIGHWADQVGYKGEIAYFYELGDRDEASVIDSYRKVFDSAINRKHTRMESTPIGVKKGKARGLEVADFLAWHWNKWFVNTDGLMTQKVGRKDIQRLMDLLLERGEQIAVYPLIGNDLRRFLISHGCEPVEPSSVSSWPTPFEGRQ